jgi:hypothetical protein
MAKKVTRAMRIEQREAALANPQPRVPQPRPTTGLRKAPGEHTYEANVTVERMRAQRRVKLLTRAKRRAEQQGKKAIDRVRHSSDIAKKVTTLQRHEKKITGITKMRDMLAAFVEDTAQAFAFATGRRAGFGGKSELLLQHLAEPNGMTSGTVYAAAASGAAIARELGNDELAAELPKPTGELFGIPDAPNGWHRFGEAVVPVVDPSEEP